MGATRPTGRFATLIQIDRAVHDQDAIERLAPPPPEQDLATVLQLRPQFRSLQLQAQSEDDRKKGVRLALGAVDLGVRKRAQVQLRQLQRATGIRGRWASSSTGSSSTAAPGTRSATPPPPQPTEARARAEVFARPGPRRPGQRAQPARDQAAGGGSRHARRRAGEGDDQPRAHAVRGRHGHPGRPAAGAGRPDPSQLALAQSRYDAAVADLALRRAAGTFPPK